MIFDYLMVFIAAACAVGMETLYRYHQGTYWQIFPVIFLPALFISFGIWKAMKLEETLLAAILLYQVFTAGARLFSTYVILGESPGVGVLVGFGLIVLAQIVSKIWR